MQAERERERKNAEQRGDIKDATRLPETLALAGGEDRNDRLPAILAYRPTGAV